MIASVFSSPLARHYSFVTLVAEAEGTMLPVGMANRRFCDNRRGWVMNKAMLPTRDNLEIEDDGICSYLLPE